MLIIRRSTRALTTQVLVPIVVLRNHVEFNPWHKGHPYSIDIDAIRKEVGKLALPNQEVTIVTDLHGLHEHKHIALALAKAHKTDTVHELNAFGRYDVRPRTRPDVVMTMRLMSFLPDA